MVNEGFIDFKFATANYAKLLRATNKSVGKEKILE